MIEGPGIFLYFDDRIIDEWYEWLNFFDSNHMKVTFFLSNLELISSSQWEKVREFQKRGHTIGCHILTAIKS